MTVDVIVNRRARHLQGETALYAAIVGATEAAGKNAATLHETHSLADLESVVSLLAKRGTDAVVLAGGDGSYMAGITSLTRAFGDRLPRVAFAPGGTVSTVARNWGLRGSLVGYTRRLLAAVQSNTTVETARSTLRVRDADGGDRVGFMFGTGLVANFFDEYYASSHQGYSGAARIVSRIFVGSFVGSALAARVLTPTPCTIEVDGVLERARAFSLVAASVVKDFGLSMRVLYRAGDDHSRVHCVASPLGAARLGPQMPLVLAGRRLLGRDHVDVLARSFRVTFLGDKSAYVLDGEVLRAPSVEVTPGPRLRVLTIK